jgi:uncharacterized protein YxeA
MKKVLIFLLLLVVIVIVASVAYATQEVKLNSTCVEPLDACAGQVSN